MLLSLLLGVLALLIALVVRAQVRIWGQRSVVHESLAVEDITPFVRSWGPWLAERGRIVVRHADTTAEVELRKRRFESRPDALVFRLRNADATRVHFPAIQAAFEKGGISWQLESTPKRKQPRAIAVPLVAEDIHTPAAACNLIKVAFGAIGATAARFRVYCDGSMRVPPDVPSVPLLPWRRDYAIGFSVGKFVGRVVKWWRTAG